MRGLIAALLLLAWAAHAATHDWSDWRTVVSERRCVCRTPGGSTGPLCTKKCTVIYESRDCPGSGGHGPHTEHRTRQEECEGSCERFGG